MCICSVRRQPKENVMSKQIVHVIGGGTISHARAHLALCAPAYGGTARRLAKLCRTHSNKMDVRLHLTKMADHTSDVETNEQLRDLVRDLVADPQTKMIFFNAAVADFIGTVGEVIPGVQAKRLRTSDEAGNPLSYNMKLVPAAKLIQEVRKERKDIFLVGFKATSGATPQEQYAQGLNMLKASSANLVLANDTMTDLNMVIVPEEATYHVTRDRDAALKGLVEMAYLRAGNRFTRSTVAPGKPVDWESEMIPQSVRSVVDHCIDRGAYKPFRGVTAGHFAVKLVEGKFLTSRRKTNFNEMEKVGLVRVETDGDDRVISYGSKPSVGGQSQRQVFAEHPEADAIVHFHCPLKAGSEVPIVSQREYECGSHECGGNTSRGLKDFGGLKAVFLDNHGPNIVFNSDIEPQTVIDFIEKNFDLSQKTGGYALA